MLYALGSNGSGQLGLGHDEDANTPQCISLSAFDQNSSSTIKGLAAGGNHTIILCTDGHAFSSGDNSDGRCALPIAEPCSEFQEISSPGGEHAWDDVAATWSATIFSRNKGQEVWVCGSGGSGELALGDGVIEAKKLTQVPNFPPTGTRMVQLAACMAHVIAVLDNGQVWGWGKGRKGQLGGVAQDAWMPRIIEGTPFKASRAVCGKDFTCLSSNNQTDNIAMLGPDGRDRFNLKARTPSEVPSWKDISASWGNVFVLRETGDLVAWGRNDHGQLPPDQLPLVAKVAAGSEHCLALTLDGKVLAWGWGEHGNCGEHLDEKSDVKDGWNELSVPGKVIDIFGGCATSFILTAST